MMTNNQYNAARDFGDIAPLEPNGVIHVVEEFPDAEFENGEPVSTIIALPDYLVVFRRDDDDNPEPLINIQKALGLIPNCMFRSGKSQYSLYRLRNPDDRAKLEYITPTGAVLFGIKAEIPIPDNDTEDAYHLIVGNHDGIVAIERDDIEEAADQLGVAWPLPGLHFHMGAEETKGNLEDSPQNCDRIVATVQFQRFGFDVEAIDTVTRKRYDFAEITPREIFRRHPNQVPAARLPDGVIALVSENLASLMAYLEAVQVEPLVTLRNGTKHAALFRKHPAEELTHNPVLPADVRLVRPGTLIQLPFGINLQNCDIQVRAYDKLSEFPFEDLAYPPPEVMELISSLAAQQKGSAVDLSSPDLDSPSPSAEVINEDVKFEDAICAEKLPDTITPIERATLIDRYSLRGKSNRIREQIVEEKPLLGQLVLQGHNTIMFGPTSSGKSLITMELLNRAIRERRIAGFNCICINADDSGTGLLTKNDLLSDMGCHTLAPGYEDFEAHKLDDLLIRMAESGEARGKFFIIDTAKKFVDPMSKRDSTRFGTTTRKVNLHGGSVLVLAHTNKYPGSNGKQQYAGTADLMQDFDAAYTIDVLSDSPEEKIVEFTKNKGRGNSIGSVAYAFDNRPEVSYAERLASVREVEPDQHHSLRITAAQANDIEVIESIKAAICTGSIVPRQHSIDRLAA